MIEAVVRERVEPVIEWLNDWSKYYAFKQTETSRMGEEIRRRVINRMLENCRVYPQLGVAAPGKKPSVRWLADQNSRVDDRRHIEILQAIIYAFERDWLLRLRRCGYKNCALWFDARNARREFHSETCRKRAYAESPAGKEKRRKFMKKYMQEYREKNY